MKKRNAKRKSSSGLVMNHQTTTECEHFVWNAQTRLVRHDKMGGRDYLVVPMVMAKEGVMAGSKGPLFYSAKSLSESVATWNHKPVVVYHPSDNSGNALSACSPDIITTYGIGVIMNTRFDNRKRLVAEAWLEPDRITAVDKSGKIMEAVENQKPLELSTGVFTDNQLKEGEFNGTKYLAEATNLRADHLAVLPDKVGAFPVSEGAGFVRNEENDESDPTDNFNDQHDESGRFTGDGGSDSSKGGWKNVPGAARASAEAAKFKEEMQRERVLRQTRRANSASAYAETVTKQADRFNESSDHKDAAEAHATASMYHRVRGERGNAQSSYHSDMVDYHLKASEGNKPTKKPIGNELTEVPTANELSFDDIRSQLQASLYKQYPATTTDANKMVPGPWVEAIFEDSFVYCQGGKLYRLGYSVSDVQVQLEGEPTEVVRVTEYRTTTGAYLGNVSHSTNVQSTTTNTTTEMNKKELVDKIIAIPALGFVETDRPGLMTFNESQLTKLATPPAAPAAPTVNEQKKEPATVEEFIANAPEGMQDVLRSSMAMHQQTCDRLVDSIVANAKGTAAETYFTKESLKNKNLAELQAIASLSQKPAPTGNAGGERRPLFSGQGMLPTPAVVDTPAEFLVCPTMNFEAPGTRAK